MADSLRAMRTACRKFIATVGDDRDSGLYVRRSRYHDWERSTFDQALGELRGVLGLHIAQLAIRYGIDVPDPLASDPAPGR